MLGAEPQTRASLAKRRHEIVVLVDRVMRGDDDGLKLELFDAEGSEGRANVVGGL